MPIIFNNFVKKEQSQAAPANGMYWDNKLQKLVKVEEPKKPKPVPVIEKKVEVQVIEEPQEQYKVVQHGDLHRLFNTKSSYLKDMADLEI